MIKVDLEKFKSTQEVDCVCDYCGAPFASKKQSSCPSHMTELQWANSRGLSRIWDCGKIRWEFKV